jgi:hypothetical protein
VKNQILPSLSIDWQKERNECMTNVGQHGRAMFNAFVDQRLPGHFAGCLASELVTLAQSPLHRQNKEEIVSPA